MAAALFLIILIKDLIQFSDAGGWPGKPHIEVSRAAEDGTMSIVCRFSQQANKTVSCYLYTGDTPGPFTSTWTKGGQACNFNVHNTDLRKHLASASSREVSCDFVVDTDPPTRSPRSEKSLIGDDKLNLHPATSSATKASIQRKTTKNSKGFIHSTTITPTTKKPGITDAHTTSSAPTSDPTMTPKFTSTQTSSSAKNNVSSLPATSTSAIKGPETPASKRPSTPQKNTGLPRPTTSASSANGPVNKDLLGYIWPVAPSLVAAVLLGVTAVCLYGRHKKNRSARIQQEPANNTEYSLLGFGSYLAAGNAAGKEQVIYSVVGGLPSGGQQPTYDLVGCEGNTAKLQEDHSYASIDDLTSAAATEQNPVYSLVQNH